MFNSLILAIIKVTYYTEWLLENKLAIGFIVEHMSSVLDVCDSLPLLHCMAALILRSGQMLHNTLCRPSMLW